MAMVKRISPKRAMPLKGIIVIHSLEIQTSEQWRMGENSKELEVVQFRSELVAEVTALDLRKLHQIYRDRRTVAIKRRRWVIDRLERTGRDTETMYLTESKKL